MTASVNGIVVGGVSGGGAAGQTRGGRGKPKGVDGASGRRGKDIVVHGDVRDGILKEDMAGHVDAEVAVKSIVINGASAEPAAALPPDMNGVVVIGVRGRIPVGKVVEMIVVDAVVAHGPGNSTSEAMIDMVDIRIFECEIVSVAGDGPRCVVTGDVINREVVGVQRVNAVDGMSRRGVRCGCADIKILNGQILHSAVAARRRVNSNGVLPIGATRTVRRVLNNAVGTAVHRNVIAACDVNRARP